MSQLALEDPALNVALALAVGMLAQVVARHFRIPGIVLLLGAGLLLGPDVGGVIHPSSLGSALHLLVGFAVAVILFEGGLNLDLKRLRREGRTIQRLVTLGALVTWAGGTLAARLLMDWPWRVAVLFGSLVIVTGPTVINPLLRRIRLRRKLATILEAEGVLVDAIGALVAVVTLEVVLGPRPGVAAGALELLSRLGFGALAGTLLGLGIGGLLRVRRLVPEGLQNVLTLSLVLAVYQLSNSLRHESGIVTVTVAGLVVGNIRTHALDDLKEFKEQLTVLFIGMLFVLLAAGVRVDDVRALGLPGALTVLALMLVVRPLNVLASTAGSRLDAKERLFLAWLAPRGIVAAAVSSLFAQRLEAEGIPGGPSLQALVFLVIAATVLLQGLSGGPVARLLGVRRSGPSGFVILGASPVGLALGRALRRGGEEVTFLDSNPQASRAAEAEGFKLLFGNALSDPLQQRADLEGRAGCVAVTQNEEVNFMFCSRARERHKVPDVWIALRRGPTTVTDAMVHALPGYLLFGAPRALDRWNAELGRGEATIEAWAADDSVAIDPTTFEGESRDPVLPLAVVGPGRVRPFDERGRLRKGEELVLALIEGRREVGEAWLRGLGLRPSLDGRLGAGG